MKIYSEILNKMFDTEDECVKAEEEYQIEQERKEAEKKAAVQAVSKEKKELASAVELAEEALNKAYDEYEIAKEEARKIMEESNKQMLEILNPARDKIKQAQKEKYNAISNFNKKFGLYTAQYTGEKALKEFRRASSWLTDVFNQFFD